MGGFMTQTLWAFVGISLLVIATPGPDTALTVRNTLLGGRRGGGFTAAGVAAGQGIWALATSPGWSHCWSPRSRYSRRSSGWARLTLSGWAPIRCGAPGAAVRHRRLASRARQRACHALLLSGKACLATSATRRW